MNRPTGPRGRSPWPGGHGPSGRDPRRDDVAPRRTPDGEVAGADRGGPRRSVWPGASGAGDRVERPRMDEGRDFGAGHGERAQHRRGPGPARHAAASGDTAPGEPAPRGELRLYGLNAVHAVFARRPEAIRKVYLAEARIPALQPLLKWCVAHRVGYRVVEEGDLQKLAASSHHEGVVADVLRAEPEPLSGWLRDLPAGPQCAIWLDGVGNPHNFGAILRSAAHFGVAAVLLPKESPLALSGAAARVAEGGAEAVPLVRLGRADNAIAQLRGAGFALAATVVEGGRDLFATPLPGRLVYVLGAEGGGMDRDFAGACDLRLSIPGTGAVESLNVAAATAVLLAAWRRGPAA